MTAVLAARRSLRAPAVAAAAVALEFARVIGMREAAIPFALVGGAALAALAAGTPRERLGLAGGRWLARLVGTAALAAVLLLPAAVRWTGQPHLTGWYALAAVVIAIGEEVAFRGVLFAVIEEAFGGGAAVVGSGLAWTLAHSLSHPPGFLPAVLTAGLVLGLWRYAMRDLVAPTGAHVVADLVL